MPRPRSRTPAARLEVRELLKGSRLRCTPAREAVLKILCKVSRPLSHAQIVSARGIAGLDRVTVYRTLSALQKAGLVHRVQDKDGVWRFSAHGSRGRGCPGNHPHFLCMRCGDMRCLPDQSLPWVKTSEGEQVMGKHFVAYGLCAVCASR